MSGIDTATQNPASWPAFLIAGIILALILLAVELRRRWVQWRCLHLHPRLLEAGSGLAVFRCEDCGRVELEAVKVID